MSSLLCELLNPLFWALCKHNLQTILRPWKQQYWLCLSKTVILISKLEFQTNPDRGELFFFFFFTLVWYRTFFVLILHVFDRYLAFARMRMLWGFCDILEYCSVFWNIHTLGPVIKDKHHPMYTSDSLLLTVYVKLLLLAKLSIMEVIYIH